MNFCNQFFNLGKHIHEKIEKSIHESIFFSINFLSLKTNHFFFDQSLTCDFTSLEIIQQKKSITVKKLIVQNIIINIKLYSGIKATWQLSYTWFIFWAFRKLGKLGKNTVNNLRYTESISKSATPHSASYRVFRLIFIQPFYVINLIWESIFEFGHAH